MPGPIQSIERAAAILSILSQAPYDVGVSEVAGALGLPKGTAHGLLQTLVLVGFATQSSDGRYRLGHLPSSHAQALDPNVLRSRAMTWADGLVSHTGLSARMVALEDGKATVIHHVFRPRDPALTLRLGVQLPLHATAVGKTLLAFTPGLTEELTASELVTYTSRTITSTRELTTELAAIRTRGWALDRGEFRADRASISAPIRDRGGRVVGAIAVVGTIDAVTSRSGDPGGGSWTAPDPVLTRRVCDAAHSISVELGAS
ncbi:MAG: IclR family transcriptional regulator [Rhodococcus sp.]|nr:IclR family transcriptional regulator [Rhodococcus sp. (in: high G+C Gram-positive bacteria)]